MALSQGCIVDVHIFDTRNWTSRLSANGMREAVESKCGGMKKNEVVVTAALWARTKNGIEGTKKRHVSFSALLQAG